MAGGDVYKLVWRDQMLESFAAGDFLGVSTGFHKGRSVECR
jgi:hypothetical protein